MGYTCSGAEFRGTVPDHNKTVGGCAAAAQALNADPENCHGGVNYAISPVSNPTACYVCAGLGTMPGWGLSWGAVQLQPLTLTSLPYTFGARSSSLSQ
jgi:hypothetical protein